MYFHVARRGVTINFGSDIYMLLSVLKPVDSLLEVFLETYFVY